MVRLAAAPSEGAAGRSKFSDMCRAQKAGAIAGLYEFAPDAEGVDNGAVEAPAENGQPDLELAEA